MIAAVAVDLKEIKNSLRHLSLSVSTKKGSLPILKYVLIEFISGQMQLTTTNFQTTTIVNTQIPWDNEAVAVPFAPFKAICKLSQNLVKMSVLDDGGFAVTNQYGTTIFDEKAPVEEFPKSSKFPDGPVLLRGEQDFRYVDLFASSDPAMPALNCIHLDMEKRALYAADGFSLIIINRDWITDIDSVALREVLIKELKDRYPYAFAEYKDRGTLDKNLFREISIPAHIVRSLCKLGPSLLKFEIDRRHISFQLGANTTIKTLYTLSGDALPYERIVKYSGDTRWISTNLPRTLVPALDFAAYVTQQCGRSSPSSFPMLVSPGMKIKADVPDATKNIILESGVEWPAVSAFSYSLLRKAIVAAKYHMASSIWISQDSVSSPLRIYAEDDAVQILVMPMYNKLAGDGDKPFESVIHEQMWEAKNDT